MIGLGTAPISGLYAPVDEQTARATLERAWELGVRRFDTAPYYGFGLAERRLGAFLRQMPRDEYVVSTKVGRLLRDESAYFDFSENSTLRSIDESLDRLGLDRVDEVLVHDPDDHYEEALSGAFPALARLREEGVVHAIGAGMNQAEMLERFARDADPDTFLIAGRWTVLDRTAERLLELCSEGSIEVVAGGVFNSGVLAGGDRFDYKKAPADVMRRVATLRETCARHGVPLEAVAVQFPLRHPAVTSVLVGCRSPAEVEEDVRLSQLEIPESLWSEIT